MIIDSILQALIYPFSVIIRISINLSIVLSMKVNNGNGYDNMKKIVKKGNPKVMNISWRKVTVQTFQFYLIFLRTSRWWNKGTKENDWCLNKKTMTGKNKKKYSYTKTEHITVQSFKKRFLKAITWLDQAMCVFVCIHTHIHTSHTLKFSW